MLSHAPEVSRLLHSEHTHRLARDAQDRMDSISLPSTGFRRALSRVGAVAHVAVPARNRRAFTH
jgi:hypothetical protein